MTKQRRSFFVDDILHMVMPRKESSRTDSKRKRSISSEDANPNEEEIFKKKARIQDLHHHDENEHESDYSQVIDVLGEEEDNESSISDNSNNIDPHNGKLEKHLK